MGKLDDDRRYLEELIKNPVLKKHHDPTGEHFGSNVVRHKVTKNVFLNNVKEQILIKLYVFSLWNILRKGIRKLTPANWY